MPGGPPWDDMDAYRGGFQSESQKVVEKRWKGDEVIRKCTETPLNAGMSGNERKSVK